MLKKLFLLSVFGLVTSCTSSGDIIGMDEINLNGPKQIIQTVSTVGSNNVLTYSVGGNKFVKLSDTNATILHEISYANNKISHINGYFKDPVAATTTNISIDFVYSGTTLTGLQGTEETGGVATTIATAYTYTNGKVSKILTTKTTPQAGGNPVVSYVQNDLTFQGYNLSQSVFTTGTVAGTVLTPVSVISTNYSGYDTKINYLYGLPLEYGLFSAYNSTGLNYLSSNNPQSILINVNGQNTTNNYAYQYGVAAMPTSSSQGNVTTNYSYQPWNY